MRAGIFAALQKRLGAALTPETRQAWDALLDLVFNSMKQGMAPGAGSPKRK